MFKQQYSVFFFIFRLEGWVSSIEARATHEKNIAFLGIKCLHELQHDDTMKSVCSKFLAGGNGELCLEERNITPVDSAALFEFLGNSNNLKRLLFDHCSIISLNIHGYFTTQGVKYLSEALKSGNCELTSLYLDGVGITDQGAEYLSEALKSGNCKLTSLNLYIIGITEQSAEYLSEALKSGNCKLTSLHLRNNQIIDQGAEYLSEALKSGNCKLTSLDLYDNGITDQDAEYLSEALKSGNCKLT